MLTLAISLQFGKVLLISVEKLHEVGVTVSLASPCRAAAAPPDIKCELDFWNENHSAYYNYECQKIIKT